MHLNRPVLLMLCFSWHTSSFVAKTVSDEVKSDLEANIYDSLKREPQHVLSRKRRYLEFPKGSSFQLVYDLLVGVVDYTNYIAISMTLALAWELPSAAPSEILEDVEERLRDGTFGIRRNDTVSHNEYIDTKPNFLASANQTTIHKAQPHNNVYYTNYKTLPVFVPPMHQQHYGFSEQVGLDQHKYSDYIFGNPKNHWRRNDPYYTSTKESQTFQKLGYSPNMANYPWWNLPFRLRNIYGKNAFVAAANRNIQNQPTKHFRNPQNIRETVGSLQRRHQIFPVFGKRTAHSDGYSVNNTHKRYRRNGLKTEYPLHLDRAHVRYQRSTRHKLYNLIEKYLERKKYSNAHSCVLRTLCETGKKSQERQPGSFVGELMRAVFTLPEPLEEDVENNQIGYKEQQYDMVHHLKADCSVLYHQCEHALWSSHLVA